MKVQRTVHEGEMIPFGYGYVRYDFPRDVRLFAPMPLNWIIRWSCALWHWLLRKSIKPLTAMELTNHERVEYEIRRRQRELDKGKHDFGVQRYTEGYEYGFKAGWKACGDHLLSRLDADRADVTDHMDVEPG